VIYTAVVLKPGVFNLSFREANFWFQTELSIDERLLGEEHDCPHLEFSAHHTTGGVKHPTRVSRQKEDFENGKT